MRIIYWDAVFIVNLFMTYIILLLTARFVHWKTNWFRLFLGSLTGSLYLVGVFIPDLQFIYTVLMKFLLSVLIIIVTFYPPKLRDFLKLLGYFYLISFVMGGTSFALIYFADMGVFFYNGIIVVKDVSVPWWILVMASVIAYAFIKYLWEFVHYKLFKERTCVALTIFFQDKLLKVNALVDTGNDLHDPFSKIPVIIVEYEALKQILNENIIRVFDNALEKDLQQVLIKFSNSPFSTRLRLIPFSSIGKAKGMLLGFRPDKIKLEFENETLEVKDTIIGIYNKALSPEGNFKALVNPDILKK